MRTNLRIIAQAARVNVATVSRALRGLSNVHESTSKRIQKIAEEMGYVRDPILSNALAYARKQVKPSYRENIAFVSPLRLKDYSNLPWLTDMHAGVCKRGDELGYAVERFQMPGTQKEQKILARQLKSRGVRGYIICPVHPELEKSTNTLDQSWLQFAGVEIDHALVFPKIPRVCRELHDDIFLLINELFDRGYRSLGIAMREKDEEGRHWATISSALLFQYFHPDVKLSCLFKDGYRFTRSDVMNWMRKKKPDVLIANGPEVYDWLVESGIKMPEDIGMAQLGTTPERIHSGLYGKHDEMGYLAMNLLASILEHRNLSGKDALQHYHSLVIHSAWHDGSTLKPANHKKKCKSAGD